MLTDVWMLLLLLVVVVVRVDGAPRARSSTSRDDATTRGDDLVTDTESGRVRGIRYHAPYLRRPVDAYLGIPFAKPPLNSLRFRHPQAIEKWRNIYNATRQPNSCYQLHDTVFGTDFYVSKVHCEKYPYIHGYFAAVPYTFVSVNRWNSEARGTLHCIVATV